MINIEKQLAFHIAQTIFLLQGIEIYTKNDLCKYAPELSSIIKRAYSVNSLDLIMQKLQDLIDLIQQLPITQTESEVIQCDGNYVNYIK